MGCCHDLMVPSQLFDANGAMSSLVGRYSVYLDYDDDDDKNEEDDDNDDDDIYNNYNVIDVDATDDDYNNDD